MSGIISRDHGSEVYVFPARTDNIGVLLHDPSSGATAAVDAPDGQAILTALELTGWKLTDLLITHKHPDHIDGIPELKKHFPDARVIAPLRECEAIGHVDVHVVHGDTVAIGALKAKVIGTPGHTLGHVAYWFEQAKYLFAGDALFALGCGRMFEGNAADMWASLKALRSLPDDTSLFCGHEYTLENARFALSIDPQNAFLQSRISRLKTIRADGKLTIPVLLGDEKLTNPFLRADDPQIASAMGLASHSAEEVFAALRALKDHF